MPANEGGTHGLYERMRSDGEIRRRTPKNAGITGNLTDGGRAGPAWLTAGEDELQKSADWLTPVADGTMQLVEQLGR
jgi:hypothetical protein